MFGFLKVFSKKDQALPTRAAAAPPTADSSPSLPAPGSSPVANGQAASAAPPSASAPLECLELPWSALRDLPDDLRARCAKQSKARLRIPLSRILAQLNRGVIRVGLDELDPGVAQALGPAAASLQTIELALSEILPRLNPSLYLRRSDQKRFVVPDEIAPLFGPNGAPLNSGAPAREAAPTLAPAPAAPPSSAERTLASSPPADKSVEPIPFAPEAKRAPSAPPSATVPAAEESGDFVALELSRVIAGFPSELSEALRSVDSNRAVLRIPLDDLEPGLRRGRIIFSWAQLRNWIQPPAPAPPGLDQRPVELPLALVAPQFLSKRKPPRPARKIEISSAIGGLFTAEPAAGALEMRESAQPAAAPSIAAAPMAASPPPAPAAARPPEPAPISIASAPPTPKPSAAPPVAGAAAKPAPAAARPKLSVPKPDLSFGEIFGQPTKEAWSPQEIVDRTAQLRGISGAFLANMEGFLIAAQAPAEIKTDFVAGLLPDLFKRAEGYARQFLLDSPGHLTLSFENVPFQVFKAGAVYFAALGRAGENLPKIQLTAIAAQLERQTPRH